jgi:mono/diheme cytochrome c family protein
VRRFKKHSEVMIQRGKPIRPLLKNRSSFRRLRHYYLVGIILGVVVIGRVWAEERLPNAAPQAVKGPGNALFTEHIQPLFQEHCLGCHQGGTKGGGLDLSTREALLKGGNSGPAIVPGNAKASLLYKMVAHQIEPGMPFKADKLPGAMISLVADWIDAGAPFDQPLLETSGSGSSGITQATSLASTSPQPKPEAAGKAGDKLFVRQVRSVLETQCFACHGGKLKQAGLSLATRETLLRGSDNGPVVSPGDAKASLLIKKIKHEHEPGMPYKGKKLSDEVIAQIVEWINNGAPYDQPLKMPVSGEQTISQRQGSDHWAYQLPKRAALPVVKNRAWVLNPIDAFISAEHEKRGLKPMPPAEKQVLLRRVYLDLVGFPPSPAETQAFLADRSSDAYEEVVEQLLASPYYGERWGRHWMDIWRYSDWYGFGDQVRNSQPQIWNWRDWIIESLNQDKGYDRMIKEMLAGDEIAPTDPKTLRATGYLARNWYRFNRNVWLQELVEHTAAGFLATTLKCARCHDHKFDPIAQEEYYRFRAFFEFYDVRMDRVPGQPDLRESHGIFTNGLPRSYDAEPREPTTQAPYLPGIFAQTYRFIRGDEKNPDKEHPLSPGVPESLGGQRLEIQSVALPLESYYPDIRPFVHQDLLSQAEADIEKARAAQVKADTALAEARRRVAQVRISRDKGTAQPTLSAAASNVVSSEHGSSAGFAEGSSQLQPSRSGREAGSEGGVSYEKEIRPIFEQNCFSCHKGSNAKSDLSLETQEAVLEGGTLSGPAVIVRKSAESPLVQYLRGIKTPRMPFGGAPLPEKQIGLIEKWIDQLPEDEPQLALKKAEAAAALAQKELASAQAHLPALEARIAADKATYSLPPSPDAEALAQVARKAERQAHLLEGEENVLRAQQRLTDALSAPKPTDDEADKAREKKVAAARKQLEAAAKDLAAASENYTPIGKLYPKSSSGRRLALATWIASKQNPLTARVAVNHMWLRHFGKALVPTVANFGHNGRPPSHPELLDWLANELMDKDWSMKTIHRLMVTSNTYRLQSSAGDSKHSNLSIDPDNRYLWRMNPRRMEAESVRDSMLRVAEQLDTTMGGPELDETRGQESDRRSIYFRHTPDAQMVFLKLFDAANPSDCYERNESVVPQQALALANSKLSITQGRLLARKISQSLPAKSGESEFIKEAFERVLGHPPSDEELVESMNFVRDQAELFSQPEKLTAFRSGSAAEVTPGSDPHLRARESLVHALFNHNDFVTIR